MKIWVDDIRPMPDDFDIHCHSVREFKDVVIEAFASGTDIDFISFDHDAGDYFEEGGDYIECLKWLEEVKYVDEVDICTKFYFHTGNPVGRESMRRIVKHCGWEEVETAEDFF